MYSPVDLTFGQDGTCKVDLAKGWKWKATGSTGDAPYGPGSVGPFNVPTQGNKEIVCHLTMLLGLRISTVNTQQNPEPSRCILEVFQDGQWGQADAGETATMQGEEIWASGPWSPGHYRVKAQARAGGDWSDWTQFDVVIASDKLVPITVPWGGV